MKTFDEKVDDAVHAALAALGLSAETCPDTADLLNDAIASIADNVVSTDDSVAYDIEQDFPEPTNPKAALTWIIRIAYAGWRSGGERLDEIGAIAGKAFGLTDEQITAYANAVGEIEED